MLTELINLSPLFVTLYVFSAYLNLIVFEETKVDLEQAYACFSVPNHCKITRCCNILLNKIGFGALILSTLGRFPLVLFEFLLVSSYHRL